jgi:hypothetical protein
LPAFAFAADGVTISCESGDIHLRTVRGEGTVIVNGKVDLKQLGRGVSELENNVNSMMEAIGTTIAAISEQSVWLYVPLHKMLSRRSEHCA